MRIDPKLRIALLIGAVVLTAGAVRWAASTGDGSEDGVVPVVERTARTVSAPAKDASVSMVAGQGLDLKKLQRERGLDPDNDPFSSRNFRPAPPKITPEQAQAALAAAPPPPPPPQAPPLPFTFMGRLSEARDTTVFLTQGERNLVVKPGDTIDNVYKLEEVSENAVVLTYLPMNQRQTLVIETQ